MSTALFFSRGLDLPHRSSVSWYRKAGRARRSCSLIIFMLDSQASATIPRARCSAPSACRSLRSHVQFATARSHSSGFVAFSVSGTHANSVSCLRVLLAHLVSTFVFCVFLFHIPYPVLFPLCIFVCLVWVYNTVWRRLDPDAEELKDTIARVARLVLEREGTAGPADQARPIVC